MSHPLNVEICKVINEEEPTAGQEKQGLAVEDDLFHRKVEIQFGLGYVWNVLQPGGPALHSLNSYTLFSYSSLLLES